MRQVCHRCSITAFSLLEMLVAMAVLSVMMAFLFNLVAQVMRAWEVGARRIEAAQSARVGLDTMARELQSAFGGVGVINNPLNPTATVSNVIPFFATNQGTALWGLPSACRVAPESGQIFAVAPLEGETNSMGELGFMCVYVTGVSANEPGYHNLRGFRYYLLRHAPPSTNSDFFYRGTPTTTWISQSAPGGGIQDGLRIALIPNCYQINLAFASNNNGVLSWTTNWASQTNMPAGVLVTAKVMDEKTAARLQAVQSNGLTAADVASNSTTVAGRILREGTVEVRRFIPFANATR
jgi:prepilin-type N-terminal cleavage/methylation domain-containing protein